ncbi:MAG: Mycothiol acetyltransferase [Chloroflexi bacterium]|nr:Mycothiol acetyltransferase [Chloroflexota bacterium]
MPIGDSQNVSIREVGKKDRNQLIDLVHRGHFKHRHLDWFPPFDWLGEQPYLAAFQGQKIQAALACPPDPPKIAWIRFFVVAPGLSPEEAWQALWPTAWEKLKAEGSARTAALLAMPGQGARGKLGSLVEESGFSRTHNVAALTWTSAKAVMPDLRPGIKVRPMGRADLAAVEEVDHTAFAPLWQNSLHALERAHQIAAFATVAEIDEQIVGYQISTGDISGGHLARLAISPHCQNLGVGTALLHHLLLKFEECGCVQVTANTQIENEPSLKLYRKFGFQRDHQTHPVYQRRI